MSITSFYNLFKIWHELIECFWEYYHVELSGKLQMDIFHRKQFFFFAANNKSSRKLSSHQWQPPPPLDSFEILVSGPDGLPETETRQKQGTNRVSGGERLSRFEWCGAGELFLNLTSLFAQHDSSNLKSQFSIHIIDHTITVLITDNAVNIYCSLLPVQFQVFPCLSFLTSHHQHYWNSFTFALVISQPS